jgi:sugar lactone lactonase YvrE
MLSARKGAASPVDEQTRRLGNAQVSPNTRGGHTLRALRVILLWGVTITAAACASGRIASLPQGVTIVPGDYVITQESPLARHQARSRIAGAAIFLLKPSGDIALIVEWPAIAGPRGIQADKLGNLVFADAFAPAIRKITPRGTIETIYEGSPLMQPKDVAVDLDGSYVVADFDTFKDGARTAIFRVTQDGKVSVIYSGNPLVAPHGIAVDADGAYVIADHRCCIYRLARGGKLTLVARGGPLVSPQDIKVDRDGNYIATDIGNVIDGATGLVDRQASRHPAKLLRVTRDGRVSVIAEVPGARFRAVNLDARGDYVVVDMNNAIYRYSRDGRRSIVYQGAPLFQPAGVVVAP